MIQNIQGAISQINLQAQDVNPQRKENQAYSPSMVAMETKPSEDRVNISREAQSRFQNHQRQPGQ